MKTSVKILLLAVTAAIFVGCSGSEPASTEPVKTDSTGVRAGQTGTKTIEAKE
jgi:hypothetical protein